MIPNFKNKIHEKSLFSPQDFLSYSRKRDRLVQPEIPSCAIICFQKSLLNYLIEKYETVQVPCIEENFRILSREGCKIGLTGCFGIGAPSSAAVLEELIALGVKKIVSIGTAGSLQEDLRPGGLVVCERAIRDEGTSYHYLKPARYARASAALVRQLKNTLNQMKVRYQAGASWTIDAPYRETAAEVKKYRDEGILTVEMEASALFAVAEFRGVELAAMFTVSDCLTSENWVPKFHLKTAKKGLETLFEVAANALTE
ncbi:MAG: nucleoside phosphorylase [Candidatus Wallbacteria bacterium]|nr:nucleoside phosphorylase [Candidatus Wallbacteria bacterium]